MVGVEKSPMTKGAGGLWRLGHCGFWFSGSDDLVWVSLPFLEVHGNRKPKASVLVFGDLIYAQVQCQKDSLIRGLITFFHHSPVFLVQLSVPD